MTKEQKEEFEKLAQPLIKWLNDNCNPHAHILIEATSAELSYGEIAFHTNEFLND